MLEGHGINVVFLQRSPIDTRRRNMRKCGKRKIFFF